MIPNEKSLQWTCVAIIGAAAVLFVTGLVLGKPLFMPSALLMGGIVEAMYAWFVVFVIGRVWGLRKDWSWVKKAAACAAIVAALTLGFAPYFWLHVNLAMKFFRQPITL